MFIGKHDRQYYFGIFGWRRKKEEPVLFMTNLKVWLSDHAQYFRQRQKKFGNNPQTNEKELYVTYLEKFLSSVLPVTF